MASNFTLRLKNTALLAFLWKKHAGAEKIVASSDVYV